MKNKMKKILIWILIWLSVLSISTLLAFLFKGEYFIIRTVIILPFVLLAINLSKKVHKFNEKRNKRN